VDAMMGTEWTLSFRMKLDSTNVQDSTLLMSKGEPPDGTPSITYNRPTNSLVLKSQTATTGEVFTTVSDLPSLMNQYNHYAWVQNGGLLQFYVNGTQTNNTFISQDRPIASPDDLLVFSGESVIEYRDIRVCDVAHPPEVIAMMAQT
jgi:hypothetical protein